MSKPQAQAPQDGEATRPILGCTELLRVQQKVKPTNSQTNQFMLRPITTNL